MEATSAATVGPVDAAAHDEFLLGFDALAQAVRRARGAVPPDLADRLTLSQYSLLLPLAGGERVRVSDLAAGAGIAVSTASRILDALERRRLVRRERAPEDRRGVIVSLTDPGRQLLHRQDGWMRARQVEFFDGLPASERAVVPDLLTRLADLIDALAAGPAE